MKLRNTVCAAIVVCGLAALAGGAAADSPKEDLRKALKDLDEAASWVYDDLDAGFAKARETGRPLLVVFR